MENDADRQRKIEDFLKTFEEHKNSIESKDDDKRPEITCEKTVKIREKGANRGRKTKVKKSSKQKTKRPVAEIDTDADVDKISKDVNESLKETTAELEKLKLTLKHQNVKPKFGKGVPKIVAFAQQRAKERERFRIEIVEKKRLIEEEKARQAALREQQHKLERIVERKKMLEKKQMGIELAMEELMKKQKVMIIKQAAIDRENVELMKRCFSAWQEDARSEEYAKKSAADEHYKKILARKGIKTFFRLKYESMMKMNRAQKFCEKKSLRTVFYVWKQEYKTTRQNLQVAEDFHDACLLKKYFNFWRVIAYQYRMKAIASAVIHYESKLLHRYFDLWKTYPDRRRTIMQKERSKEKWREAVREIVPDFEPHVDF